MQNIGQLKKACFDEIERAFQIVEKRHNILIPRVPIVFSSKMTKCGGRADGRWGHNGNIVPTKITLSLPLLKLNGDKFVMDVPAHEAMHIAAYVLYPKACVGHGYQWKALMRLVGRDDSRTHQLEVVHTNRVPVYCGCDKTHMITKRRASNMRKGFGYRCNICMVRLSFQKTGEDTAMPERIAASRPSPNAPTAPQPKTSKSDIVRKVIAKLKGQGITLDEVLGNPMEVQIIAASANLTVALAKTYIKNNWKKV